MDSIFVTNKEIGGKLLLKPIFVLLMTLLFTTIHKIIILIYGNGSYFIEALFIEDTGAWKYIGVFFNHFIVQIITVVVLLLLTRYYLNYQLKKTEKFTFKNIIKFEIYFIPIILISFFIYYPLTTIFKNLFIYLTETEDLFNYSEILNMKVYASYLIPASAIVYFSLNYGLLQSIEKNKDKTVIEKEIFIKATDDMGEVLLKLSHIMWFIREDRMYFAVTKEGRFKVKKSISQINEMFEPEGFIRLNRYVLVNLAFVKNYSYWHDEKYIVRMNDGITEFPMTRERLKSIKNLLTVENI